MEFTHKRIGRKAVCLQFTDATVDKALDILNNDDDYAAEVHKCNPDILLVRNRNPTPSSPRIFTLCAGDWLVIGENGITRRYTDEQFKIKYETL